MVPLDRWFGSFHDGTPEAHEAMRARRLRRGVQRHRLSPESQRPDLARRDAAA